MHAEEIRGEAKVWERHGRGEQQRRGRREGYSSDAERESTRPAEQTAQSHISILCAVTHPPVSGGEVDVLAHSELAQHHIVLRHEPGDT